MEYEIGPNESASVAVVRAVSAVEGRKPRSLRPLADALDTLIRSTVTDSLDGNAAVTFTHDGYEVTVQRDATVVVRPVESGADSER